LFSYENTVAEGKNLRSVKSVHRDERVVSLAHKLIKFAMR